MQDSDLTLDNSENTASRLLKTAAALFREKGYSATSTRELAKHLGIQNASLYHHIRKKEDLLYSLCMECLENIQCEVEQAVASYTHPLERLQVMIEAHMDAALSDQDKHATMLIELHQLSVEPMAAVLKKRDKYEALVKRLISEAQDAGYLRQDLQAKYQALALLNLLNWSIFWFRSNGELDSNQLAKILATIFLNGAVVPHEKLDQDPLPGSYNSVVG